VTVLLPFSNFVSTQRGCLTSKPSHCLTPVIKHKTFHHMDKICRGVT